jgi:organic radical activating enzyme
MTARELAGHVSTLAGGGITHVVFTGGEPLLQLEREHVLVLRDTIENVRVAVETNGVTQAKVPSGVHSGVDWICVSPKLPADQLTLDHGNELKVVFPAYDPLAYEGILDHFDHLFVSPEAPSNTGSFAASDVLHQAVNFCLEHPRWRLSMQTHKYLEIP